MGFGEWRQASRAHRDRRRTLRELPGCGACGHGWEEHAGAWGEPEGEACGECVYESDHGELVPGHECRAACPLLSPLQVQAFSRLWGELPRDPTVVPADDLDADYRHIDSWLAGVRSSHQASSSQVRDLRSELVTDTARAFVDRLSAVLDESGVDAPSAS